MQFAIRVAIRFRHLVVSCAALALLLGFATGATAQIRRQPLLQRPLLQRPIVQQLLQPKFELEAISGQPFGVGKVTVPLEGAAKDADLTTLAMVNDKRGRIFYPAYESSPVRQIVQDLISAPPRVTIYFLFRGAEPLELTSPVPGVVQTKVDANAHQRLLNAWWREYVGKDGLLPRADSGPPEIRAYLTGMLARRLSLPITDPLKTREQRNEIMQAMGILTGNESIRTSIMQETLAGLTDGNEPANVPLPAAAAPANIDLPADAKIDKVVIEPIAMRVPEECLYVRFGNFPNFLWLRQRLDSVGGDLANFVAERGVDYGASARMERQLCVHQNALAPVLGPQVIADVAFIGTDTFQREGAALGILFHAKNNNALRFDFGNQRAEALKRERGAIEEKVKFGDVEASFLHTPENEVRSFYVQDGDFHLVTNSRAIAARFVETGKGIRALGQSAEFRYARQLMPVDRDHTAFIYLSEAFQRNLLGPQYQVEMVRRIRSMAEMELLQLARLAAASEGVPGHSVQDLADSGMLPAGFGARADGSHLVETKEGLLDSLRGRRGSFMPVPDVPIQNITASEARELDRFRQFYGGNWEPMDPVLVGVRRHAAPTEGLERVIIDAQAAPFAEKHYEKLSKWLGPPSEQRLALIPGDLISLQASVRGGTLMSTGDHILFGALRDADPSFPNEGLAGLLFKDLNARGYIGAYPQPGLLSMIGGAGGPAPDANGFSRLLLGQWRRIYGDFTLLSFHPEVLDEVAPQLRFEPASQPAQIWLHAEDLANSKLARKVNNFGYKRALHASQGNARFINSLTEQLHVAPKQDFAIAETLVDAKLIDPLGGKYELLPTRTGRALWMSTVVADPRFQGSSSMPADYQFPAMKWLRGMDALALMQPTYLVAHAEIDLPAMTRVSGVELPSLPSLPSLPFSIPGFGPASPPAGTDEKPATESKVPAVKKPSKPATKPAPSDEETLPAPPPAPGPAAPIDGETKPKPGVKPALPAPGPPAPGEGG